MNFKKIILPMIAFIFSLGMLFAFSKPQSDPNNDYVQTPQGLVIIPEQNCSTGSTQCRVQFGEDGPIYKVYDDAALSMPKLGDGSIKQL
ncbi:MULTISPECIES: DUF6520 family protein [Christiangramia]|uniref:Uncharacterized protein n=1 Tax=Christiangramia flava JLT2011 TaxID=1229726 RepID=A0A1L7I1Z1_9FLAO|nr:DUF6520 family protein [Christiangramia flava]APU67637.1 hypothetical protein GRFL_0913 [Christiangramia flava JLT2011]OSS37677.1 hypothetical protein C723_3431 [Christiangramia flava JLT2011]